MNKGITIVIICWLTVVGSALMWNLREEQSAHEQIAFDTARAFFQQTLITRLWNARHGGVYVPITPETPPNPFLEDPLRDLTTDSGMRLTKINPAYMTRQISELACCSNYGIQFHITSLKPIRPENKPTPWEKEALLSFEQGKKETGEFIREEGKYIFRYMAPLPTEESCLRCHGKQGYKAGDIRGGISVTLPHVGQEERLPTIIGYGGAALFGVVLIILAGIMLNREKLLLLQANESLQTEIQERQKTISKLQEAQKQVKALSGIVPICMHCKEIRDDRGYWNKLEKFISEHSEAQFSHSICDKCMQKYYPVESVDSCLPNARKSRRKPDPDLP